MTKQTGTKATAAGYCVYFPLKKTFCPKGLGLSARARYRTVKLPRLTKGGHCEIRPDVGRTPWVYRRRFNWVVPSHMETVWRVIDVSIASLPQHLLSEGRDEVDCPRFHPTAARLSGSPSSVEHLQHAGGGPRRSLVVMLDTWLDPSDPRRPGGSEVLIVLSVGGHCGRVIAGIAHGCHVASLLTITRSCWATDAPLPLLGIYSRQSGTRLERRQGRVAPGPGSLIL